MDANTGYALNYQHSAPLRLREGLFAGSSKFFRLNTCSMYLNVSSAQILGSVFYRVIRTFLVLGFVVQLQAQSTHHDLTRELIKDLYHAVSDSASYQEDQYVLLFQGDSQLNTYLNRISVGLAGVNQSVADSLKRDIVVTLAHCTLSINQSKSETSRNTAYVRQLDLGARFTAEEVEYFWQSKISDRLSKANVKDLLNETFPEPISGNYLDREPPVLTVMITTLSIFSLVAVLFFIRT